MEIIDKLSALNASSKEIWDFLGREWNMQTNLEFINCYGIYSSNVSADGIIGRISHVTLSGNKTPDLPFGEKFIDSYFVWDGEWKNSLHPGFVKFRLKLQKQENRIEKEKPFLFTVDPKSIKNVYEQMASEEKEAQLKSYWGVSNNLICGTCVQRNNKFYLENFRSEFGKELKYPDTKESIAPMVFSSKANPVVGATYYFMWKSKFEIKHSEFEICLDSSKAVINEKDLKKIQEETNMVKDSSLYTRILDNWKTGEQKFVGCYDFDKERDIYCFTDIRSVSFQELKYPNLNREINYQAEEIIIPLSGPVQGMTLKSYYKIGWTLLEEDSPRGYSFVWDEKVKVENIQPSGLIKLLNEIWDKSDISVAGTMDETMKMVSSELMSSSDGTFIYELLQNANDYPVEKSDSEYEPVDVEFHITDNYLIFRHSGDYFSPKDIAAICKLGAGTKKRKKNAIGYKGIGFKTVFNSNEYVYVKTGDYSFRFDRKGVNSEFDPWQIMPIATGVDELPQEVKSIIKDEENKFRVQIAIRPEKKAILHIATASDGTKSFEYLFNHIFQDIRDIVFIPNIRSVKVYLDGKEVIRRSKTDDENWIVSKAYVHTIEPDEQVLINKETREFGKSKGIPDRYIDFGDTTVLFACKKERGYVKPVENATVNCYLPSQAKFGFPFLMNTDMVPSGDRNELKTNVDFNKYFAHIAGNKFALWLNDLIHAGYEPNSVFSLIPDFSKCCAGPGVNTESKYSAFIKEFEQGFYETVEFLDIVPVRYEKHAIHTASFRNVVYDATRISGSNVMKDEQLLTFCNLSGQSLPVPSLRTCEPLRKLHDKFKSLSLSVSGLVAMFTKDDFYAWLKVQENNNRWLKYLLDYSERSKFSSLKMFIEQNSGEIKASNDLYYDVDKYLYDLDGFKEDIPYLSPETRRFLSEQESESVKTGLTKVFSWGVFNPETFVSFLLCGKRKDTTLAKLRDESQSERFFHMLASEGIKTDVKCFPIFTTGGLKDNFDGIIYFTSDNALSYQKKAWLKPQWFHTLSEIYFKRDADKVTQYFRSQGVKDFSTKSLIKEVILDKSHQEDINSLISTSFEINKDFIVSLLFANRESISDLEVKQFVLSTLDAKGGQGFNVSSDVNLFFSSDSITEYQKKSWTEPEWLQVLDERYGASQDNTDVRTFFKDKFGIAAINPSTYFKKVVKKHLDDILRKISAPDNESNLEEIKQSNFDFFSFIGSTVHTVFEDGANPFKDRSYPFIDLTGKITSGPKGYKVFYADLADARAICKEPWIPESFINVAAAGYGDSASSEQVKSLMRMLGLEIYSNEGFLSNVIIPSLSDVDLLASINQYENNLAFHRFFKENRKKFPEEKLSLLKNAPVCCGDNHIPAAVSGKEMMNPNLRKVLAEPSVKPSSPIDFIGEDYQDGTKEDNNAYWIKCLGARDYSPERILTLIKQSVGTDEFKKKETNLSIWRLVKALDGTAKTDLQKFLASCPLLCHKACEAEDTAITLQSETPCYIADRYFTENGCIENLLRSYSSNSLVASAEYLQSDDNTEKTEWFDFWERMGFLSSNEDLILNSVLPTLKERDDDETPLLIYSNRQIIDAVREERISELSQLKVKTRSGEHMPVTDIFFIIPGLEEPMKYILLKNEISDSYTPEQTKYFKRIAEDASSVHTIGSTTAWAELKIRQYLDNQDLEIHDKFICDMVSYYADPNVTFSLDENDYKRILLKNKDGNLVNGSSLTLGSSYAPEICDFEKCGVQGLQFISDKYLELGLSKPRLRDFLSVKVGAHRNFETSDISRMADNYDFCIYIWTDYILTKYCFDRMQDYIDKGCFKGFKCIPNTDKVCLPEDLYSKDLRPFAKYLVNSAESFPLESIPEAIVFKGDDTRINPMFSLPLNDSLTKEHCYEILLNSDPKSERRVDVLNRLIAIKDDITQEEKNAFRDNPHALWLNGALGIAPLNTLYGIGTGEEDKYYRRHFQTDPLIIHESTVGDLDYLSACDVIGLGERILTSDDFEIIQPEGKDETSENVETLKKKSILLATVIDSSENYTWDESYKGYRDSAEELKFFNCDSLTISCKVNPDICSSDVIEYYFDEKNKTFYYVYGWQERLFFSSLVNDLCRESVMNIKTSDIDTVSKIINEDLKDKRLTDFVKKYCQHFIGDKAFRDAFYECYPEIAVKLGWNIIEDAVEEETAVPEKIAYSIDTNDEERGGNETQNEQASKPSVGQHQEAPHNQATDEVDDVPEFRTSKEVDDVDEFIGSDEDYTDDGFPEPDLYDDLTDEHRTDSASGRRHQSASDSEDSTPKTREHNAEPRATEGHSSSRGWQQPKKLDSAWVTEGKDIKPISLGQEEFSDLEYDEVANLLHTDREAISDQNYLARKRFYDSLIEKGFQINSGIEDFIKNEPGKVVALKDGRYIHRCSAAKGILYISPSIWNKLKDDRCIICVYAGKKANEFIYFRSQQDLLAFVKDTAILIQVIGQDKGLIMDRMYSGSLQNKVGDLYAMIPIKPQGAVDVIFTTSAKDLDDAANNIDEI